MQPASSTGADRSRALRRWGPIAGVLVLVAVVVGLVLVTRDSGDDETAATTTAALAASTTIASETTAAPTESTAAGGSDTTTAGSTAPAPITFPLSFAQATEQGNADSIDWGTRCDTSTGRLAVPDFFAQPCFAPFTGDNGGATAPGVTADEITIVYYEGQEAIRSSPTSPMRSTVDDTNGDQFATMKELVRYYETYFEMYGRKVNLVTFEGTGIAIDEVAAAPTRRRSHASTSRSPCSAGRR